MSTGSMNLERGQLASQPNTEPIATSGNGNESDSDISQVWRPTTVETILADSSERMTDFLLSKLELRPWDPPTSWHNLPARSDDEMRRVRALPMLRMYGSSQEHYYPDMLLYALGELEKLDSDYPARLADFVSGDGHLCLCNASGTGKTRLVFETLAHNWGIYLTCAFSAIADPYGSSDLPTALFNVSRKLLNDRYLEDDLPLSGPGSRNAQAAFQSNRDIAARVFRCVMLARLLVLDHFVGLVVKLDISDDVARRKWLLLQLRPEELVQHDIFEALVLYVADLSDADIAKQTSELYDTHCSRIAFVALDEAQVALNMFPRAFAFRASLQHASLLGELLVSIGQHFPRSRMIASGTQCDLDLMSDAIQASCTRNKRLRFFHSLGSFRTQDRISRYLAHFLGSDLGEQHAGLVHKWLRGRHRLVAVLIMCTLMAGDSQISIILDTLVFVLTGYRRAGANVLSVINIGTAIDDKRLEAFPHCDLLRRALLSFARRSEVSSYAENTFDLVRLGVAMFTGSDASAEISEPLMFLTLCRWLQRSAQSSAHGLIRRRLADEVHRVDDKCLLAAVAACFAHVSALPDHLLHDYLRFSGPEPSWARSAASVVLPRMHAQRLQFAPYSADSASTLLSTASTADDVFVWMKNAEAPFLIPDKQFGASMLCFLRLAASGSSVLVCFHLLSGDRSRRDNRCVPSKPEHFYRKVPRAGKRLREILQTLPELPLPVVRGAGRQSSPRSKPARFSLVHLLCFADPYSDKSHDPPLASINFVRVLLESGPTEVHFSDIEAAI